MDFKEETKVECITGDRIDEYMKKCFSLTEDELKAFKSGKQVGDEEIKRLKSNAKSEAEKIIYLENYIKRLEAEIEEEEDKIKKLEVFNRNTIEESLKKATNGTTVTIIIKDNNGVDIVNKTWLILNI